MATGHADQLMVLLTAEEQKADQGCHHLSLVRTINFEVTGVLAGKTPDFMNYLAMARIASVTLSQDGELGAVLPDF